MFKPFFGLTMNPFDKETSVSTLFESADFKELSQRLSYMLKSRGIALLVGEPGYGKTTGLRHFTETSQGSLYKFCYLPLTTLTVRDFYHAIAHMLGVVPKFRKIDLFVDIQQAISSLYYDQKITPVFIIDEVHMASTAVLDDIRLLFNFRIDSANPFVLILCGQPLIRNKLMLQSCYPLRQRITMRYTMQGLTPLECEQYLTTRMTLAGCSRQVFSQAAATSIANLSGGAVRSIGNLAVASLMYAAQNRQEIVDEEAVLKASMEIGL